MKKLIGLFQNFGTVRGLQLFQLLRFGAFFIIGIFLAKSQLDIRDIGCYESMIFISGGLSFFWVSGILNGLLSSYTKNNARPENALLTTAAITINLINVFLILLLWIFKDHCIALLPPEAQDSFNLILLYMLFNNPAFLIEYIFVLLNKALQLVIYGAAIFFTGIFAVIIPIYLGYPIQSSFYALIVVAFFKNIYLVYLLRKYSGNNFRYRNAIQLVLYSVPLIMSMLISGSAEYIDGFLVSTNFGSDAFAIFRYGAKELPVSLLMANALSMAVIPRFTNENFSNESLVYLKKETNRLMHILFPLTIVLMLSSHWIYPIIFRAEFVSSAHVFNVYLLLLISRMLFPQPLVMAHRRTRIIFSTAIIEISVNIISSYLLLQKYGIIGVAYGSLIAYLTEKGILMVYTWKHLNIAPARYFSYRIWLFYTFLLLIVYVFSGKAAYLFSGTIFN